MDNSLIPVKEHAAIRGQAQILFDKNVEEVNKRTDRLFGWLLATQWLICIFVALLFSPRTWIGTQYEVHVHVLASVLLGGVIILLPVYLAIFHAGQTLTRHTVAASQMLMGALLIHLSGGRIETHFHVFGSLAFLAFYRDCRVLVTATVVVALDHFLRGIFWPQSVFGIDNASSLRWLEHVGWVVFEDIFLVYSCRANRREMWQNAERQAALLHMHATVESTVNERTHTLRMRTEDLGKLTQRLNESVQRFQGAFESTTLGMAIVNLEGGFVDVNRALCELLGYSEEELLSRNFQGITHPDDLATGLAYNRQMLDGTIRSCQFEKRYLHQSGRVVWAHINVSLVRDDAGKPLYFVVPILDITERKFAAERVRELHHRLQSILDAATEVLIVATDRDGNITLFNRGAELMLGYTADEMVGKQTPNVFHLETEIAEHARSLSEEFGNPVSGFDAFVERARRGGFEEREWTYVRKDGSQLTANLVVTSVYDSSGNITGFLGIATDITARKQAELELQKAKRAADSASQAKSEFLANVSHEVRTPLNGILGMTELALDSPLSTEQREYLDMVRYSANSLLAVINDILDFSKIEAGKLDLERIQFDLSEMFGSLLRTLSVRSEEKGLELIGHIESDVPVHLNGDPNRLRQILVNLIGNAIKFTECGEVVCTVRCESTSDTQAILQFSVADSGIGIPRDKQALIFNAFAQADSSTTRRFGGTGLGLSICKQLVTMMHGQIWLESEADCGSTFHFTAMLDLQDEAAQPSEFGTNVLGMSVLVVDDSATNRRILEKTLQGWGMKAIQAESGEQALSLLGEAANKNRPYQLILLDYHMPAMDGFDVVRAMKEHEQLREIPVVILSSGIRPGLETIRDLGIAGFLLKPVCRIELKQAIKQALQLSAGHCTAPLQKSEPLLAPLPSFRVLLAEDNLINQKLAVRLLENQGHSVTLVDNGVDAVAAWEQGNLDLILMDVQMPRMGGFEATALIRARELELKVATPVPIIAMTAHAMKGDRERCLDAGMNEYLSKPISSAGLAAKIRQVLMPDVTESESQTDELVPSVFDRNEALERLDGDTALLDELIAMLIEICPKMMAEMRDALSRQDFKQAQRLGHTFKGTFANLAAGACFAAAERFETVAGLEAPEVSSAAARAFAELENAVDELLAHLGNSQVSGVGK